MTGLQSFEVMINPTKLSSILEFSDVSGRFYNFKKEVYFLRYIGFENEKDYIEDIIKMDRKGLSLRKKACGYLRLNQLGSPFDQRKISRYSDLFDQWSMLKKEDQEQQLSIQFPYRFQNEGSEITLKKEFALLIDLYKRMNPFSNASIIKNLAVKLFYWMDMYLPKLFYETKGVKKFPKFVFYGGIKTQEYMFLYLLVRLGCDVLYLNPEQDPIEEWKDLRKLSDVCRGRNARKISIPLIDEKMLEIEESKLPVVKPNLVRERIPAASGFTKKVPSGPLEYEELAKLATSVVMIMVFNKKKECFKSGSGVFINQEGYILTNFHVASEGAFYGIRLDENEEIYYTDELIKYHQLNDLAIIKVTLHQNPIPVYQGEKNLVRGQRVVAIGSPLGLCNSVSDGIISGFRNLDHVSMIQFTAPTSHGSSGGALLDLYGNLIGIISAGFDDGENLNLAVDYKTVLMFVRGFLP